MNKGFDYSTKAGTRRWLTDVYTELVKRPGYEKIFEEPDRIFNGDETGFQIGESGQMKVMSRRGKRKVSKRKTGTREMITCLCTGNAAGTMLPYYIVTAGRTDKPAPGTMDMDKMPDNEYRCTESGWMKKELIHDYVMAFDRWVEAESRKKGSKVRKPVLLILDGAKCHLSAQAAIYAKAHQIVIWLLPPHSTSNLQPMDITYNGPLKKAFHRAVAKWSYHHPQQLLRKNRFVSVLKIAADKANARPENISNGFKFAGIYPFNPAVHYDDDHKDAYYDRPDMTTIETFKELERRKSVEETHGEQVYVAYGDVPNTFPQPSNLAGAHVKSGSFTLMFNNEKFKIIFEIDELNYKKMLTWEQDDRGMPCRYIPPVFARPERYDLAQFEYVKFKGVNSDGTMSEAVISPGEYIVAVGRLEVKQVRNFHPKSK